MGGQMRGSRVLNLGGIHRNTMGSDDWNVVGTVVGNGCVGLDCVDGLGGTFVGVFVVVRLGGGLGGCLAVEGEVVGSCGLDLGGIDDYAVVVDRWYVVSSIGQAAAFAVVEVVSVGSCLGCCFGVGGEVDSFGVLHLEHPER